MGTDLAFYWLNNWGQTLLFNCAFSPVNHDREPDITTNHFIMRLPYLIFRLIVLFLFFFYNRGTAITQYIYVLVTYGEHSTIFYRKVKNDFYNSKRFTDSFFGDNSWFCLCFLYEK